MKLSIWMLSISTLLASPVYGDWPQYRSDNQRTAFRVQDVGRVEWHPNWAVETGIAASPVWPAPARASLWQNLESIEARVTHDRCDHPIIAADGSGRMHVLLAQSGGDRLIAFEPETGALQWQFCAGAPIRYAPATVDGLAVFGSDDGMVRAVDIASGQLEWETQVGPGWPWIAGNGRLISPHPVRTGIVVEQGKVFTSAGLFPSQGVYCVSLDALSGELDWRIRSQESPQGYAVWAGSDRLIMPTGRAQPFMLEANSGDYLMQLPSAGGSFCMVDEGRFFSGPGNADQIGVYEKLPQSQRISTRMLPLEGRPVAAGHGLLWWADDASLQCYRLSDKTDGDPDEPLNVRWSVRCENINALIVSGEAEQLRVFCATDDSILIYDAHAGTLQQRLLADSALATGDQLLDIAVSAPTSQLSATLIAVSKLGRILSWSSEPASGGFRQVGGHEDQLPQSDRFADSDAETFSHTGLQEALQRLPIRVGYALLDATTNAAEIEPVFRTLVRDSELKMVIVCGDPSEAERLRIQLTQERIYGRRVVVRLVEGVRNLNFADQLFNLVVTATDPRVADAQRELNRVLATNGIMVSLADQRVEQKRAAAGTGEWLHQYGNVGNTSSSSDASVGAAYAFRLRWFGGVGPSRLPDRHLRGPAPLAAGNTMIIHGDGVLIGVDAANGTERWQLKLPAGSMRYVMPYDAGYSALAADGSQLWTAVRDEIWNIDTATGAIKRRIALPDFPEGLWGYLAQTEDALIASAMRATAPRFELDRPQARDQYANQDYNSNRPLVCSRRLVRLSLSGDIEWAYDSPGLIPHGSISIDAENHRIVFIEGLGEQCQDHPDDRATVSQITSQCRIHCRDTRNGNVLWSRPLELPEAENILFTQVAEGRLVIVTSRSHEGKAEYHVQVSDSGNGDALWQATHTHVREGLYHGEQVHHPLVLQSETGARLVVEPYVYDLSSGERIEPFGASQAANQSGSEKSWALLRPGHSCGTLTGAGDCLFFRASNPTVLNLRRPRKDAFTALSPSRPSCWINMIPATGLLLIPEGSASCVCSYPLQTSMAFAPINEASATGQFLEDYPLPAAEQIEEIHAWNLKEPADHIEPEQGAYALKVPSIIANARSAESGKLASEQWWTVQPDNDLLPPMPRTITIAAWIKVRAGNGDWAGIVSALEDNGSYERGCLLGLKDDRFVFGLVSKSTQRITYLSDSVTSPKGEWLHLAGSYDGRLMKLYVNGKLRAISRAQAGDISWDRTARLAVGAYWDQDERYPFVGEIGSVSIFRGALPPEQIRVLAASMGSATDASAESP